MTAAASRSRRGRRLALIVAATAGGSLGAWYVTYAYWLAVGLDGGLVEHSAWHRLFLPGIRSVYLLGPGWAALAAWALAGAGAGLGVAAVVLRARARGDTSTGA